MRTNIEIDDRLMRDALRASGAKTKREAVELGLRTLLHGYAKRRTPFCHERRAATRVSSTCSENDQPLRSHRR